MVGVKEKLLEIHPDPQKIKGHGERRWGTRLQSVFHVVVYPESKLRWKASFSQSKPLQNEVSEGETEVLQEGIPKLEAWQVVLS